VQLYYRRTEKSFPEEIDAKSFAVVRCTVEYCVIYWSGGFFFPRLLTRRVGAAPGPCYRTRTAGHTNSFLTAITSHGTPAYT